MTSIGGSAFEGCSSLTSITIPNGVTSIVNDAFEDCSKLKNIYYTGDIASWCGIDGLDNLMLFGRTLYINGSELSGNLVIPNSVTSIGSSAFYYCSKLTSITIPDSVTSIGEYAFSGCSKIIQTENGVQYVDKWVVDYDTSVTQVSLRSDTKGIADSVFEYRSSLKSITIPNNVTSIGREAFRGCKSLTSITIPDSVTSIGYYAFSGCSSLTSITIPDSVTKISDYTFQGCSSLTSITIPDGVTSIGWYAFDGCSSLTSINFNGTTEQWNAIKKGYWWNSSTGNYTVHCTDGTVAKDGTVTKN